MLPITMMGAASQTNSRKRRQVLRRHLAEHRPPEGEHLHDQAALVAGQQPVQAEPGEDADDDEHGVDEQRVLPPGDAGDGADDDGGARAARA